MEWLLALLALGVFGGFAVMAIRFAIQERRRLRRGR